MIGELLAPGSQTWSDFLWSTPHDVYHLPEYVSLSAHHERGEPIAFHVSDGTRSMLLPLILRTIPAGGRDATSPYGYPGPLTHGTDDPRFLCDAMHEAERVLAEHGVISLFVRLHPLLNREPPEGDWAIVSHGDTIGVDLSLPSTELWHQTRANHRRQINRATRSGHVVRFDDWSRFDDFKRLYHRTMERHSADPFYLFDDTYFDLLRTALGTQLHLVTVGVDSDVAAAGLFTEISGIVQFHLGGSDERYLDVGPTKLMLHEVRCWARGRGDRWFHLGGGLGATDDSLMHFKVGFSPLRFPFHTLRAVLLEREYESLTALGKRRTGLGEITGYFPGYRRVAGR